MTGELPSLPEAPPIALDDGGNRIVKSRLQDLHLHVVAPVLAPSSAPTAGLFVSVAR